MNLKIYLCNVNTLYCCFVVMYIPIYVNMDNFHYFLATAKLQNFLFIKLDSKDYLNCLMLCIAIQ